MSQLKTMQILLLGVVVAVHSYLRNPYDAEELTKKHYSFAYGIKDDYRGLDFNHDEMSDGNTVRGSYSVQLSDGRKQTVTYQADHKKGFFADVTYDGKAFFPSKANEPPFVVPILKDHFLQENQETEYQTQPEQIKPQPETQFPIYSNHQENSLQLEPETPESENNLLPQEHEIETNYQNIIVPLPYPEEFPPPPPGALPVHPPHPDLRPPPVNRPRPSTLRPNVYIDPLFR